MEKKEEKKKKQYNTLEEQNGSRVVVAGCSTKTEENAITWDRGANVW